MPMATRSGAQITSPAIAPSTLTMRAVRSAAPWFLNPLARISMLGLIASMASLPIRRSEKSSASSTTMPRTRAFEQRLQRQLGRADRRARR